MIKRIEAPEGVMVQWAPFPEELAQLVKTFKYKPGWRFRLVDAVRDRDPNEDKPDEWWSGPPLAGGLTLIITSLTYNSYRDYDNGMPPDYAVQHFKIVPAATFNRAAWKRWLLDMCLEVEQHEAAEFVDLDGSRPFAPTHGPGDNPYTIKETATDLQRRTSFKGTVKEEIDAH